MVPPHQQPNLLLLLQQLLQLQLHPLLPLLTSPQHHLKPSIYSKNPPIPMTSHIPSLMPPLLPEALLPNLTQHITIRKPDSNKILLMTSPTWSTTMTSQARLMKPFLMNKHASDNSGLRTSHQSQSYLYSYRRLWRTRHSLKPCSQMHEAKIKKCFLTSISSSTCERSKSRLRQQRKTTMVFHIISSYMTPLTNHRSK